MSNLRYYDFFEFPEENPFYDEATIEDLVFCIMTSRGIFRTDEEELEFLRSAQTTLKNEVMTCYEFLNHKNLLKEYRKFRYDILAKHNMCTL